MPFSEAEDNDVLDQFVGKTAWTYAADRIYLGLSSSTPTKTGTNVTEPTEGTYARVQVTGANWATAASSATSNSGLISFPDSVADTWDSGNLLTHIVIYDALTTGNFLGFISITGRIVGTNTVLSVPIGDLDITMGGT
jgi:hypothetical protein